jgi:GDP-L-fucose synthase
LGYAPYVTIGGSGAPLREFLHVEDLADALVFLMRRYSGADMVNVGSGEELSISGLARLVAEVVDYQGRILFDPTKPDGTPRKRLDTSRLESLGWHARISLVSGLRQTFEAYTAAAA